MNWNYIEHEVNMTAQELIVGCVYEMLDERQYDKVIEAGEVSHSLSGLYQHIFATAIVDYFDEYEDDGLSTEDYNRIMSEADLEEYK